MLCPIKDQMVFNSGHLKLATGCIGNTKFAGLKRRLPKIVQKPNKLITVSLVQRTNQFGGRQRKVQLVVHSRFDRVVLGQKALQLVHSYALAPKKLLVCLRQLDP